MPSRPEYFRTNNAGQLKNRALLRDLDYQLFLRQRLTRREEFAEVFGFHPPEINQYTYQQLDRVRGILRLLANACYDALALAVKDYASSQQIKEQKLLLTFELAGLYFNLGSDWLEVEVLIPAKEQSTYEFILTPQGQFVVDRPEEPSMAVKSD